MSKETIVIDGEIYVKESSIDIPAAKLDGKEYCIIRTYSAGVFAGYVESRDGKEAVIRASRGIWYWDGSCGLSELAVNGTSKPENCKFTVEVDRRELTEVIEVLPCTEKATKSIKGVAVWKKS